ncbi:ABC transporter substrate-binding protein [Megalodesulfovibrio gigas]|nr:ABC transporter substrate binding protein [Megalodesulfovibrio gigas]
MQRRAFMGWLLHLGVGLGLDVATGHAMPETARRVFVLQSYNPEYVWCRAVNLGLEEALHGIALEIETVYLDAKRIPDPVLLQQAADEAFARMEAFEPHVVVSVDDAAQALLVAPRLKGRDRPQVIFCGVNAPLSKYGFPMANISGVRERWHYREGFALLKRIAPQASRVAFLLEASDAGGYVVDELLRDLAEHGPYDLELAGVEQLRTFQDWKERILHYQTHADALALGLYNALLDDDGTVVHPDAVMAWTNSVNTLPTLGFSDVAMEHDLLCGILESGHEQGYLAGLMVREVLTGVIAGRLPPRINERGVVMVNLKTAEILQLSIPYEIIEAAGVVLR